MHLKSWILKSKEYRCYYLSLNSSYKKIICRHELGYDLGQEHIMKISSFLLQLYFIQSAEEKIQQSQLKSTNAESWKMRSLTKPAQQ